jgi:cytochrome c-type biogenesis protein CcmH
MILWIVLATITAAALVPLLLPLARPRALAAPAAAHDAEVYRAQLKELDAQAEHGLLPPEEAEAARAEIARRLLAADREASSARVAEGAARPAVMVAVAVVVPALALGFYLVYGAPQVPDQPLEARLNDGSEPSVASLVAQVEARLRENPQDGQGWDVIAPVYMRIQRFDEAADAYRRAMSIQGETPERLVGFGEALTLANQGIVPDLARKAFEKAKSGDDNLIKAHFWLATAEEQEGRFADAAKSWRALLAKGGEDAPWRDMAQQRMAAAEQKSGAPRAEAPGPSAEDVAAAESMSQEEREKMIARMVDGLDRKLAANGDDLDGWLRLVRAYSVLGRRDDALGALERARTQFRGDEKALAALGALAQTLGLSS